MKSTDCKTKSKSCALLAAMTITSALTLCGCASKYSTPALNIYQPDVLTIEAGASVQTVDGVYTAQTRETWHSDKRYRELERKYLNLLEQ